jgi:hypothetical protein
MRSFRFGFLNTQLAFNAWIWLIFGPHRADHWSDFFWLLNGQKNSEWGPDEF